MARIASLPNVTALAYTDGDPLGDDLTTIAIRRPGAPEDDFAVAQLNSVTADYFSVLGLPIVRGRSFTEMETANPGADSRPVVVSETTARNLWPEGDPIGQTLLWGVDREVELRVVGVAADAPLTLIGQIDPY